MGTLGAHGFTAVMLYGWFVKLFGLSYHTIVICNAVWVSLGAAAYCALIRPRPARAALLALCLMLYAPAVLYCASSMTEMFNYALMLFYLAFLGAYRRGRSPWMLLLACLTVTVGCLYRITYFLLFIPVILCYARMKPGLRMAVGALVAAAAALDATCSPPPSPLPYTQGFLYHLLLRARRGHLCADDPQPHQVQPHGLLRRHHGHAHGALLSTALPGHGGAVPGGVVRGGGAPGRPADAAAALSAAAAGVLSDADGGVRDHRRALMRRTTGAISAPCRPSCGWCWRT